MKLLVKLFGRNKFVMGSPYEKKADLTNYYSMYVTCKNCEGDIPVYFKKGVHVNDVVTGVICENCGVRLEKQEK